MDPNTSEASAQQLELARGQGEAYGNALHSMTGAVAHEGGELVWRDPGEEENLHVEASIRNASDGRFVPAVKVIATLTDADGTEVGIHEQPLLWHPMIYHYGRNWLVPTDGRYRLHVRVDPPTFMRHDEVKAKRSDKVVEVELDNVQVNRGAD